MANQWSRRSRRCFVILYTISSLPYQARWHVVSGPAGQINTIVLVTMVKSCDSLERFRNIYYGLGTLFYVLFLHLFNGYICKRTQHEEKNNNGEKGHKVSERTSFKC